MWAIGPAMLAVLFILAAVGCLQRKSHTPAGSVSDPDWKGFFIFIGLTVLIVAVLLLFHLRFF